MTLKKTIVFLGICLVTLLQGCSDNYIIHNKTDYWLNNAGYYDYEMGRVIPEPKQIGKYKNATFYFCDGVGVFSAAQVFCLDIQYDKENYEEEKQRALSEYVFWDEPVYSDYDDDCLLEWGEKKIGNYVVKVLKIIFFDDYPYNWTPENDLPERLGLFMYNDANNTIVYCLLQNPSWNCFGDTHQEEYVKNSLSIISWR